MEKPQKTLDDIKKQYKYELNPEEKIEKTYNHFIGEISGTFYGYEFKERLEKLNKKLKEKATKMDKNTLKSYEEKLKDLEANIFSLLKQVRTESNSTWFFLYELRTNFSKNQDIPNAPNICENIYKDIFDNEVKKYINYEKKYMFFNDIIDDINKQLNYF